MEEVYMRLSHIQNVMGLNAGWNWVCWHF